MTNFMGDTATSASPYSAIRTPKPCTYLYYTSDKHIAIGHDDGYVTFWTILSKRMRDSIKAGTKEVMWISSSEPLNLLFTQNRDGMVRVWKYCRDNYNGFGDYFINVVGFCTCDKFDYVDNGPNCDVVMPYDKTIGVLFIKNLTRTSVQLSLPEEANSTMGLCMSVRILRQGTFLACYESGCLIAWKYDKTSVNKGNVIQLTNLGTALTCFDYLPPSSGNTYTIMVGTVTDKVYFVKGELGNDSVTFTLIDSIKMVNDGVSCLKVRADGRIAVAGCWDNRIRVFSVANRNQLAVMNFHDSAIFGISFRKHYFAVGGKNGLISLWKLYAVY